MNLRRISERSRERERERDRKEERKKDIVSNVIDFDDGGKSSGSQRTNFPKVFIKISVRSSFPR